MEDTEDILSGVVAGCHLEGPLHNMHHMEVDRTLFMTTMVDPDITRENVRKIVVNCDRCQSIDPAPSVHKTCKIRMEEDWKRPAKDVT